MTRLANTLKEGSLNDALYKSPIQTELFDLIIRFRSYKYVLCADIAKMYRQVLVQKDQTALQSIVWRDNPGSEIQDFELCTLTYGTKPASFLATRCLLQLAENEKERYPRASEVIRKDFYMDDMLTGDNTKTDILNLKSELTELLAKGAFELHKWNTNVLTLNQTNQLENNSVSIGKEAESKLLGVLWSPSKDVFSFKVSVQGSEVRTTKRTVLSEICRLFDPLGLVGPVITLTKIIMQELWSLVWDGTSRCPCIFTKRGIG